MGIQKMIGIDNGILSVLFCFLLAVASRRDWKTHEVSDVVHIGILALAFLRGEPLVCILGIFLVGLPLFVAALISDGKIGGADVKIMGAIGGYLGVSKGVSALLIGLGIAISYSYVTKTKQQLMEEPIALVPFLSMGSVVALFL